MRRRTNGSVEQPAESQEEPGTRATFLTVLHLHSLEGEKITNMCGRDIYLSPAAPPARNKDNVCLLTFFFSISFLEAALLADGYPHLQVCLCEFIPSHNVHVPCDYMAPEVVVVVVVKQEISLSFSPTHTHTHRISHLASMEGILMREKKCRRGVILSTLHLPATLCRHQVSRNQTTQIPNTLYYIHYINIHQYW